MFFRGSYVIGAAILFVAISMLIMTVDKTFFGRSQPPAQRPQPGQGSTQWSSGTTPAPTVVRDQHGEANRQLAEASVYADQALNHTDTWQREIVPLRESSAGDTIAADSDLVGKLAFLFREERAQVSKIQAASERIEVLRKKLDKLATQTNPGPVTALELAEIRELHRTVEAASKDWREAVDRARAIEREATRRAAPVEEPDLQEKIVEVNDKETLEDLDTDREFEREQAAKDRELEAKAAAEAARLGREKEKLRERALTAEVRGALAPFLEPRDVQPRLSGSSILFRKTYNTQPMSLSKLDDVGALAATDLGLMRLALVGANRKLPPPRWGMPLHPGNWSADEKKRLKGAQEMLREFGPLLVEAGWLSP